MNINEVKNENLRLNNLLKKSEEENAYLKKRLNLTFSKRKRLNLIQMTKKTQLNNLRKIKKNQAMFFNESVQYLGNLNLIVFNLYVKVLVFILLKVSRLKRLNLLRFIQVMN